MPAPTCVSCQAEMQLGFVPEATLGGFFVSVWHPGDATTEKKSFIEKLSSPGGVRYASKEVLAIDAWRCPRCGRLDLFANQAPEPGEGL